MIILGFVADISPQLRIRLGCLWVCNIWMVIEVVGQTARDMADPKGDARVEGLAIESCADVNLR